MRRVTVDKKLGTTARRRGRLGLGPDGGWCEEAKRADVDKTLNGSAEWRMANGERQLACKVNCTRWAWRPTTFGGAVARGGLGGLQHLA